jgi:hypothetical protein
MSHPDVDRLVSCRAVLDAEACAAVRHTVHALREHWIARDDFTFHTLGAALYLDAPTAETLALFGRAAPPPDQYARRMVTGNAVLAAHFAPLYAALAAALAALLGAEVRYARDRALPGFHVFGHSPHYGAQSSHVPHFDRQYECIAWEAAPAIDFEAAISVTLPICLPQSGGGLRTWALSLAEVQAVSAAEAKETARRAKSHLHAYRVGELVCHRGHLLHQIAPWTSAPGDERLTLQAHGLYYDGAWQLYW